MWPVFSHARCAWQRFLDQMFPLERRLRRIQRMRPRPLRKARLSLEWLEDRITPAGITVSDPLDAAQLNVGTNDPTDVNGQISLRSAIAAANVDAANGVADNIAFNLGSQTIILSQGVLELTQGTATVTINGANQITVSGNQASNVFQVDTGASVVLQGLTITGGSTTNDGGGIDNTGVLTVTDCTVSGNTTAGGGGGIENFQGTLTVSGSTFSDNTAQARTGGGIDNNFGTLTVVNSTFSGNSAVDGAALDDSGTMTVTNCTLSGNTASMEGGGIQVFSLGSAPTINNSIVAGNQASAGPDIDGAVSGGYDLIGAGDGMTGVSNGSDGNQVGTSQSLVAPLLAPPGQLWRAHQHHGAAGRQCRHRRRQHQPRRRRQRPSPRHRPARLAARCRRRGGYRRLRGAESAGVGVLVCAAVVAGRRRAVGL